jgi:hypothetical protein
MRERERKKIEEQRQLREEVHEPLRHIINSMNIP